MRKSLVAGIVLFSILAGGSGPRVPIATPVRPPVVVEPAKTIEPGASCETTLLFSSQYGDTDHVLRPEVGSPDHYETYADGLPSCVGDALAHHHFEGTDNPRTPHGRWFPFVLRGHPRFDPEQLKFAVLRFDVYYHARFLHWPHQIIQCFDEIKGNRVEEAFVFGPALIERLTKLGQAHAQWISINVDLVSGRAHAHEIDAMGCPVPGKHYGEFASAPESWRLAMVHSASDGTLVGILQNNMRLSYVSLIGVAGDPSLQCAAKALKIDVAIGDSESVEPNALDAGDGARVHVKAASKAWDRRVEFVTELQLPEGTPLLPAWLGVQIKARALIQPENLNLSLWSYSSDQFDEVAAVTLQLGRETSYSTCVSQAPQRYVSPERRVRVRLHARQPTMQGITPLIANFEIQVDLLRITAPKPSDLPESSSRKP